MKKAYLITILVIGFFGTLIFGIVLGLGLHQERFGHREGREHGMSHGPIKTDKDFIKAMIPHHQEALTTSNYVLEQLPNTYLKDFLSNIIEVQEKEIKDMKLWYYQIYFEEYKDDGFYKPMMGDLTRYSGSELEKEYIEGMIFHHRGAVKMSKDFLPYSKDFQLKELLEKIITTQDKEVQYMDSLLINYY